MTTETKTTKQEMVASVRQLAARCREFRTPKPDGHIGLAEVLEQVASVADATANPADVAATLRAFADRIERPTEVGLALKDPARFADYHLSQNKSEVLQLNDKEKREVLSEILWNGGYMNEEAEHCYPNDVFEVFCALAGSLTSEMVTYNEKTDSFDYC